MDLRLWRLGVEMLFVLSAILVLKIWVFPFFISIWFPTDGFATMMQEWTVLMVGIISCFIYLGLGSSAKHTYHLTNPQATAVFLAAHLLGLIWPGQLYSAWIHLIEDLFALFLPQHTFSNISFLLIYYGLFLVGRRIRVKEEEKKEGITGSRSFANQKR